MTKCTFCYPAGPDGKMLMTRKGLAESLGNPLCRCGVFLSAHSMYHPHLSLLKTVPKCNGFVRLDMSQVTL